MMRTISRFYFREREAGGPRLVEHLKILFFGIRIEHNAGPCLNVYLAIANHKTSNRDAGVERPVDSGHNDSAAILSPVQRLERRENLHCADFGSAGERPRGKARPERLD